MLKLRENMIYEKLCVICLRNLKLPEGFVVWPLGPLEPDILIMPEGFAVLPLSFAVCPLGRLKSFFSGCPKASL